MVTSVELSNHVTGIRVASHAATVCTAHTLAAMCYTPMQSVHVHTQDGADVVPEKNTLLLVGESNKML